MRRAQPQDWPAKSWNDLAYEALDATGIRLNGRTNLTANGVNVSASNIVLTALQVTKTGTERSTAAEAPGNANPDNNFRYDAASNSYQYNLSTKGLASGAYALSFTAGSDPTLHTVSFQVK